MHIREDGESCRISQKMEHFSSKVSCSCPEASWKDLREFGVFSCRRIRTTYVVRHCCIVLCSSKKVSGLTRDRKKRPETNETLNGKNLCHWHIRPSLFKPSLSIFFLPPKAPNISLDCPDPIYSNVLLFRTGVVRGEGTTLAWRSMQIRGLIRVWPTRNKRIWPSLETATMQWMLFCSQLHACNQQDVIEEEHNHIWERAAFRPSKGNGGLRPEFMMDNSKKWAPLSSLDKTQNMEDIFINSWDTSFGSKVPYEHSCFLIRQAHCEGNRAI